MKAILRQQTSSNVTESQTTKTTCQKPPRRSKLSPQRQAKIISLSINGKSARQIAAETGHSPRAIKAVLHSSEGMKEINERICSSLFDILPDAVKSIRRGIKESPEFAYKVLERFGSFPSIDLRNLVQAQATHTDAALDDRDDKMKKVSPYLKAFSEEMQNMIIAVCENFNLDLPVPLSEMERNKQVQTQIPTAVGQS